MVLHRQPWPAVAAAWALMGAFSAAVAQERVWLAEPRQLTLIRDTSGDLFGNPHRIFPSPDGGFVLDDWLDMSVRRFSSSGDMIWRFGRRGSGPGEFARLMDVEFDAAGNLMVLDVDLGRVTVVNPDGDLLQTAQMRDGEQLLPRAFAVDGGWAVMPRLQSRADTLWVSRADGASRFVRRPPQLVYTSPVASEGWATNVDGRAIIWFRWSSQVAVLNESGQVDQVFEGIEPISFPGVVTQDVQVPDGSGWTPARVTRINPTAVQAAVTASVANSRIYVHFAGATDDAQRIVDTYAMDGEYLGSRLLPHPVRSAVALSDGRLATLETDLIPTVRIWTLQ